MSMARFYRSTVAGSLVSPFLLASMLLPCVAEVNGATDVRKHAEIDLTPWCVQLPIGSPRHPREICPPAILTFADRYFSRQANGSIFFDDPGVDCVTTAHSLHCRSELREIAVWQPNGTNTLSATLEVTDAAGQPVIGQIHDAPEVSVRPLIELFYNWKGTGRLVAGVEQCLSGGCIAHTDLGPDPIGRFAYVISYGRVGGAVQLSVSIDGEPPKILSTPILGVAGYFKAGVYGQSSGAAVATFYALSILHHP
jgi:hypothetical protein